MTDSKVRQRRRREVASIVRPLPLPYVLEEVARRLGLRHGWLEVRLRQGFVQHVTRARILSPDGIEFPTDWGDTEKREFMNLFIQMARELPRFIDLKFDDDQLRSIVVVEEFAGATLMERYPKPSQRTKKRRIESANQDGSPAPGNG